MAGEGVKLYGAWGSPFTHRVEIALQLKGIPYNFIQEDTQNKSPELLKYNPIHKKIPVLVHNGKPIVESQVILEYIDETWPDSYPILPRDPYDRAMARFWAKFIDDMCFPSVSKTMRASEEEQDKASEEAQEHLRFLEKELKESNKKFFGGERVGYVDIVACLFAHWIEPIQETMGIKVIFTEERYPCLSKWAKEFSSCDIIKENLPERERLIAIFKARVDATKASVKI